MISATRASFCCARTGPTASPASRLKATREIRRALGMRRVTRDAMCEYPHRARRGAERTGGSFVPATPPAVARRPRWTGVVGDIQIGRVRAQGIASQAPQNRQSAIKSAGNLTGSDVARQLPQVTLSRVGALGWMGQLTGAGQSDPALSCQIGLPGVAAPRRRRARLTRTNGRGTAEHRRIELSVTAVTSARDGSM